MFLEWLTGQNTYRIEPVTAADEAAAQELVRSRTDKDWSLCDALSFVVMKRLHIRKAFSFDRHFREFGALIIAERASEYGSLVVEHQLASNALV